MSKRVGANYRIRQAEKRRNPSKKKKTIIRGFVRGIMTLGLSAVVGVGGFISAKKVSNRLPGMEFLKVNGVAIRGVAHVDTSDVLALAGIQPGISLVDLKIADIRERIQKNPWIEDVTVSRNIFRKVGITIRERKPVALVNVGSLYLTDRTGFLWPLGAHEYWGLPVMSGLSDTVYQNKVHRLKKADLQRMNDFLTEANKVDAALAATISQIAFKQDNVVSLKLETCPFAVMLEDTDITRGLLHLKEIVRTIEHDADNMPRMINLSCTNLAFVQY